MTERYFVDGSLDAEQVELTGPEAHHLLHVMRAEVGDEVTLFDGSGREAQARIERLGRASVELTIRARSEIDRELSVRLTLAVALPKGDRQRWLVEKAVELGVARLVPLRTERSTEQAGVANLDRLRRAAIEAAKQCGRNRLMEIAPSEPLDALLTATPTTALRLFAHPGQSQRALPPISAGGEVIVAIGPEGGFTAIEAQQAEALGWQVIDLGSRKLRVETAALALAAAVMLAAN